jgi:hypothetical protein
MAKLRVILMNKSGTPGNLVVYQRSEKETLTPLAWQSHHTFPQTSVRIDWEDTEWIYAWSATTQIQPGAVFTIAQVTPATPTEGNQIELQADADGTLQFVNQKNGAVPGYFTVIQAPSIPLHSAAVGLGMDGKAAFATLARPNSRILFGSQISYWITFGDFAEGEFLFDLATLPSARLDFPPGVTTLVARLNADFSWTVGEASQAEAEAEAAMDTEPSRS